MAILQNGAAGEKEFEPESIEKLEQLFNTLGDWNHQLGKTDIDFEEFGL